MIHTQESTFCIMIKELNLMVGSHYILQVVLTTSNQIETKVELIYDFLFYFRSVQH
jgi:hypothetical protein